MTVFPKQVLRPTYAEINLSALVSNFQLLSRLLPKNTEILAMVKADAYGHGVLPVAKTLLQFGVAGFGVATIEEGIELRQAGIDCPVLVMGGLLGLGEHAAEAMIAAGLTPVIHSADGVRLLNEACARCGKKLKVHLKIDTGMGRLGVRPEALALVLARLKQALHLQLEGVMTHFAEADNESRTAEQIAGFEKAMKSIKDFFPHISVWHAANSQTIIRKQGVNLSASEKWWARPGIALYGSSCGVPLPKEDKLEPVMSIKSQLALIKRVPAGSKISYGGTYVCKRETRLAVVPVGYADGYPWRLSGKAFALVQETRVPVIGRVTMDMIMLDITDLPQSKIGDEVVLLGKQGAAFIGVDELSNWAGVIPYEVLSGVSKRIPRIYVSSAC